MRFIIPVLISLVLVGAGLYFFFHRLKAGDFEHGERLALTPLADDETAARRRRVEQGAERIEVAVGADSFVVAHRLSTVQQADQILVLHHGNIIESGSHADLMARQAFYYRLQHLQG